MADYLRVPTAQTPTNDIQTYLTACHEAGHAGACLLRGAIITSVTIEPDTEALGRTCAMYSDGDASFVTYAGPWAEARGAWGVGFSLGDPRPFSEVLVFAQDSNREEMRRYRRESRADQTRLRPAVIDVASREALWRKVLERNWPGIQAVAARLLAGPATGSEVAAVFDEHT